MKNKPYSQLTALSLFMLLSQFCFASLPAPSLNSPFSNATVKSFEAKLFIYAVAGATGYQFQYDTVISFNSPGVKKDTTSTTSFVTQTLRTGKAYYWRVRAFKPGDTSSWSGRSNFNTFTKLDLLNPLNNTTGTLKYLACSTASFIPEVTYIFDVDTVNDFSSAARMYHSQNTPTFGDTSLLHFGSKLYWRATAVSSLGDTLEWSPVFQYTIYKRPILYGIGMNVGPAFKLSWAAMDLADVSLQIDTVDSFTSGFLIEKALPAGTVSDTFFDLTFGKSYFFRLRGKYGNSVSDWSQTQLASIATKVSLSVNQSNNIMYFNWQKMAGANTQIQFSDDSLFTQLRIDTVFTKQQIYFSYEYFSGFNKRYYSRQRHFHSLDTTAWTVYPGITNSGIIELQTPVDRLLNVDVRTHFTFMNPFWTTRIVLEIDTGYAFGTSHSSYYVKVDSFTNQSTFILSADTCLHYNQRYVWRVYGIIGTDTGTVSEEFTFVTKSIPIPQTPQANMTGVSTSPICRIMGLTGSTFVQWQLDTTPLFNSPQLASAIDPHSKDPLYPNLIGLNLLKDQFFNTNYYWRVRCISPVDTSDWTLIFKYTTTKPPIKLISPLDKDTDVVLPPILRWSVDGGLSNYRLQYRISRDSILDTVPIKSFVTTDEIAIAVDCDYDTTYFWQVRAMHSRDTSEWSPVYRFRTVPYVGLSELFNMPDLKLYPNPAQDKLTIELKQPFSASVYNIKGELVFQTHQNQLVLNIDTKEWGAGLYVVKVISGERTTVRKLIMSK